MIISRRKMLQAGMSDDDYDMAMMELEDARLQQKYEEEVTNE